MAATTAIEGVWRHCFVLFNLGPLPSMSITMHRSEGGCLEAFTIRFCLYTWN